MNAMNAKTRAVDSIEDAQRALDRALTELDAIPSFDPALVGFVAHALNSYVNAMTATAELLQQALRDSADSDVKVWVEGIRHATDLMHHTIGRLLHSSSPSDFPLKPTYVNLPVMMDRASRYYRRLAQPNRVEIVCHADADVPLVWADRVAVAVVVDNLLSNALKVSPPGSTISIDISSEKAAVVCSIKDAGRGLSSDQQVRLSEQMTAGAADRCHPSDGYELAVAWEFVDRMGGRLWFETEPGPGTRFLLRLPART
jgi:signal transduction histidine kinase